MPKISVSLPEDVLSYVDGLGGNRSQAIARVLRDHRKKQDRDALAKAYEDYAALCAEDDEWVHWESASLRDLAGEA